MSAIKLTLGEVNATSCLITSDAHRKFKKSLDSYHDTTGKYYRNMEHCSNELNRISNAGSERLQGLILLFLGNEQLTETFKKYQVEILDDRKLFGALLIAGKHYKDELLTGVKEVA